MGRLHAPDRLRLRQPKRRGWNACGAMRTCCPAGGRSDLDEVAEVFEFDGDVDIVDHDVLGDVQDHRGAIKNAGNALSLIVRPG